MLWGQLRACRIPSLSKEIILTNTHITFHDSTFNVVGAPMSDPTLLILVSLADGGKHGYSMIEDIHAFAGVRLGPGTLYGAITRLEKLGWIRPIDTDDRRRPYRLTAEGRRYLQEQLANLQQIASAAQRRLKHA
jgi:DNA-binding PadR family transcriptional regulator